MLSRRNWSILTVSFLGLSSIFMAAQTSTPLEATGGIPLLTSNTTASAYTLSEGRTTSAPSGASFAMISLGTASKRYRYVEFVPYGVGSAGRTFSAQFFGVKRNYFTVGSATAADYEKILLGTADVTLGSTAGVVSSGGIKTTDLIGATLVFTPSTYTSKMCQAFSCPLPVAHSPGSSGTARLVFPDFFNCSDFIVESKIGTATSCNWTYEKGT